MSDTSEWLSLRGAADLLGVHPATVRSWADRGDLPSRRTPGGHRRFRRADVEQMAHNEPELQPRELQIILQNALGQTRMRVGEGTLSEAPWYEAMSDATRQALRVQGREVLEELRGYLSQGAPDSQLSSAIKLGERYAALLLKDRLSLPQAMRGFFYFSDFVINSILTWLEVTPRSAAEWGALLKHVNTYTDTMLLSIVEYYESDEDDE
jgi:excisionase family DNA binding protein